MMEDRSEGRAGPQLPFPELVVSFDPSTVHGATERKEECREGLVACRSSTVRGGRGKESGALPSCPERKKNCSAADSGLSLLVLSLSLALSISLSLSL